MAKSQKSEREEERHDATRHDTGSEEPRKTRTKEKICALVKEGQQITRRAYPNLIKMIRIENSDSRMAEIEGPISGSVKTNRGRFDKEP
ncbi:hypothetical protein CVT25_006958 [Psilocybe cyanescens]|uniref:Uncharacterized protein n=1 Tax=Psilocybe cyanescens TaxID=93625 RepID=A0A409VSH3_PSICY|nr:hypothetical protein CVT25_006958 [Psilocybe cyanescens]